MLRLCLNREMFNLHSLGWHSFQQLCLSIAREVLGQTVNGFLDSRDGGRDGAFSGTWTPRGGETFTGEFVIQCKFTNRVGHNLQLSDAMSELEKAARLVGQGRCDVYVLLTNAGLSGTMEDRLTVAFKAQGVKQFLVFGSTWIEQQITDCKKLRMLVPRVYGLGDLTQILDERAYAQATAVLESMRDDLARVVVTQSYQRAATALDQHRFVLLLGEPAAGKTTIASMLAMASADQWQASIVKVERPEQIVQHWNPHEPSQFFWIDDAFGMQQYEYSLASGWNQVFAHAKTMLKQGSRIVMTSRDYIYNAARRDLKASAFPLLNESHVVIEVQGLTTKEREQIVYNHIRLGNQTPEYRRRLKPHLKDVAAHPRFIPEIARRLGDPHYTARLHVSSHGLADFVERRSELLEEILGGMDRDCRAALALIYMRNGILVSPVDPSAAEIDAIERLGSTLGKCLDALQSLRDSFVVLTREQGELAWRYKHPTIGDAYAGLLKLNPELLSVYVHGTDAESLIEQITCGEVEIQGAIVVPRSMYQLVIERLTSTSESRSYKSKHLSSWFMRRRLTQFLATRCSSDFLQRYLVASPSTLDAAADPSSQLSYSPEVRLAKRLYDVGLLPESHRQKFAEHVVELAVSGLDAAAMNDEDVTSLLTEQERDALRTRMKLELVPRLYERLDEVRDEFSEGSDAGQHMTYFKAVLATLAEQFAGDDFVTSAVSLVEITTDNWVADQPPIATVEPRDISGATPPDEDWSSERSIFDDVDG